MLDWVKSLIAKVDKDEALVDIAEARLCATALLVETAMADGIYATIEEGKIGELVRNTWNMNEAEATELVDQAEQVAEQAVDHHRFTRVVKRLPEDERVAVVEGMWHVAFSDGEESPFEDAFVGKVADLLHVSVRASRLARQRALELARRTDVGGG